MYRTVGVGVPCARQCNVNESLLPVNVDTIGEEKTKFQILKSFSNINISYYPFQQQQQKKQNLLTSNKILVRFLFGSSSLFSRIR
ncbi:hypothetical protein DERP_010229 [Dermatophagoides pteronyssinus]|uniref:Uncharacterized protein n=1 Tax=Dermatophagoides pteronyssinus TaxID=6956 RepID=A0ABQ8J7L4_DERPT|nr:hypothetical protein DERP_010229 [Dermatophagoides pteronyssinus]